MTVAGVRQEEFLTLPPDRGSPDVSRLYQADSCPLLRGLWGASTSNIGRTLGHESAKCSVRRDSVVECGGWRGMGLTPLSSWDPLPHFKVSPNFQGLPQKRRRPKVFGVAAALHDAKRVGERVRHGDRHRSGSWNASTALRRASRP